MITIYSDGSCLGDNTGATAVVVFSDVKEISSISRTTYTNTTSNRMEMRALIEALELAAVANRLIGELSTIYSDSTYTVATFNNWMDKWSENNWTKANKEPCMNLDLVKTMWAFKQLFPKDNPPWEVLKIKGHAGTSDSYLRGNTICDRAAVGDFRSIKSICEHYDIEWDGKIIEKTVAVDERKMSEGAQRLFDSLINKPKNFLVDLNN